MTKNLIVKLYGVILALSVTISLYAQQEELILEKQVKVTVPQGWTSLEAEGIFYMVSSDNLINIMISLSEQNSMDVLKTELTDGVTDEDIDLKPVSAVETLNQNSLGVELSGSFYGTDSKAYLISIVNPMSTVGVVVLSVSELNSYSSANKKWVQEVASKLMLLQDGQYKSVQVTGSSAVEPPQVIKSDPPAVPTSKSKLKETTTSKSIKDKLAGKVIEYFFSHFQSFGNGSFVNVLQTERISLCRNGMFDYFEEGGTSASSSIEYPSGENRTESNHYNAKDKNKGYWNIGHASTGKLSLELRFMDGRIMTFEIKIDNAAAYLNGKKFEYLKKEAVCN